jgi:hypothetical protein
VKILLNEQQLSEGVDRLSRQIVEGRQEVEFEPEFVAFRIPNKFVVGYRLDYQDEYRNLPCLAVLEPDDLRQTPFLTAPSSGARPLSQQASQDGDGADA